MDWGRDAVVSPNQPKVGGGVPIANRLARPSLSSTIDLRLGQVSTVNSPVAVSAALQNGESITILPNSSNSNHRLYDRFWSRGDFAHQIGRAEDIGWSVNVNDTPNSFMSYGPFIKMPAGDWSAEFSLMIDNVTADNGHILTIDVFDVDSGKVLTSRQIHRRNFSKAFAYQDFTLQFSTTAGHRLEFRTFWHGGSYVKQHTVSIFS